MCELVICIYIKIVNDVYVNIVYVIWLRIFEYQHAFVNIFIHLLYFLFSRCFSITIFALYHHIVTSSPHFHFITIFSPYCHLITTFSLYHHVFTSITIFSPLSPYFHYQASSRKVHSSHFRKQDFEVC